MTSQKETSLKGPPTSYSLFSELQAEPICVSEFSATHLLTVGHPKLELYVNLQYHHRMGRCFGFCLCKYV